MRELLRKHPWWFALSSAAALALRLLFILRFSLVTTDSFIYGDIAKNWLLHRIYGLSGSNGVFPTFSRLPGYPAFLAAIFAIFGMEHYRAALFVQMLFDIGTCFLIADLARRTVSPRAGKIAFLLAALCPFFANYVATALTEILEIFFTALALDGAVAGLQDLGRWRPWMVCGLATGAAILLRPDGGLLLASLEAYLLYRIIAARRSSVRPLVLAALMVGTLALAPLVPWTVRNFHTLHRFEPLAPRYANEEDELVPMGFNRWTKTWIADYTSVEEIYWNVPGSEVDPQKLPSRAFDSPQQRDATLQLLSDYNQQLHVPPALDARFNALASERIRAHPLRYYVWLPALRIADMWLRPRAEILPADPRWWEFNDEPFWSIVSVTFGLVGAFYLIAALAGLARGRVHLLGLLLAFVIVRSLFLGSLENPEPRYTLECYPVIMVLAAAGLSGKLTGPRAR